MNRKERRAEAKKNLLRARSAQVTARKNIRKMIQTIEPGHCMVCKKPIEVKGDSLVIEDAGYPEQIEIIRCKECSDACPFKQSNYHSQE